MVMLGNHKGVVLLQGYNGVVMAAGWSLGQSPAGTLLGLGSSNGAGRSVIVQHILLAMLSVHACRPVAHGCY